MEHIIYCKIYLILLFKYVFMYLFSFLQNDLYFMKKSNSKNLDEKQLLMTKINELNLFNDRSEKELNEAKALKQVQ